MPSVIIPEDTFRRLSERAAALNMSVDDLVQPALARLAEGEALPPESSAPLAGDAWRAELEAWKRDAECRADRYPAGFVPTIAVTRSTASEAILRGDSARHQHSDSLRPHLEPGIRHGRRGDG